MDFLNAVFECNSDEEVAALVTEYSNFLNESSKQVDQLGFGFRNNCSKPFKGFIPFKTRIRYSTLSVETYSMDTQDFIIEFFQSIRNKNIRKKGIIIYFIEHFMNEYFGLNGKENREDIFYTHAFQNSSTDEEFFALLEKNNLGTLRGTGAAECSERSAFAQQILSMLGIEVYYCMGNVQTSQEAGGHCFNIIKRKDDYAILDYSITVNVYRKDSEDSLCDYFPFVGEMSNEEFEEFLANGTIRSYNNYCYLNINQKETIPSERKYTLGSLELLKQETSSKK